MSMIFKDMVSKLRLARERNQRRNGGMASPESENLIYTPKSRQPGNVLDTEKMNEEG